MEGTRYERGLANLASVDGEGGRAVVESLGDIAPDLGRYIVEFAFGDVYERPGLGLRDREVVTIACLCAQGACEPQLKVHVNGSLNVGMTREEVIETFIQCVPYVGFPRVLNAVAVAREVFAERDGAASA
ncbi:carboxymuconolactone decarboxylase [Gordonibacter sp. 28C]|uniref:carboxymuconolactone decarboxylase family protein n=1 Tax=Gordonibacter sp. 28C TaxID=2078569 RepID=UPI000DF761D5|nr:carboxymuconolactone decarboxylase family protein [Gordonibacter sp. 28C]RDB63838.1 carboxymuconolactone decarboxylase [Gordonibacter sp. 28C]